MKYGDESFLAAIQMAKNIDRINNMAIPIGLANALLSAVDKVEALANQVNLRRIEKAEIIADIYSISRGDKNTYYDEWRAVEKVIEQAFKEQTISADMSNALAELKKVRDERSEKVG